MKRHLLISSAFALIATPAFAQADDPAVSDEHAEDQIMETQADIDGDGDLETLRNGYTDDHDWVDAGVFINDERVADVERVHYDGEQIDALVLEHGGVADLGGREVKIALDDAEMTSDEDGETRFELAMTREEFEGLPDFDESLASASATSESLTEEAARESETWDDRASNEEDAAWSDDRSEQADLGDDADALNAEEYDRLNREGGAERADSSADDAFIGADGETDLADNQTQMDVDGDGELEVLTNGYTDDHPWIDAEVRAADGEVVGEVERVHYEGDQIDTIVIETGGIAEIGGREVEIPLENAEMVSNEDGTQSFELTMAAADVDALSDFDESKASNYPLSQNPLEAEEGDEREDDTPADVSG